MHGHRRYLWSEALLWLIGIAVAICFGSFAREILEILKIGGTPHADRDVRVQTPKGFVIFKHKAFKNTVDFNDFAHDS